MKIAVLEPYIEGFGGAQKVIAEYCHYLESRGHKIEILTQRYNKEKSYSLFKSLSVKKTIFGKTWLSPISFMFLNLDKYDIVIANDWPTHFASIFNNKVIWICYSPKRDFYDLKDFYLNEANAFGKFALTLKRALFRGIDKIAARKVKIILANSENVAKRIKKYYGMKSEVMHHGIKVKEYYENKPENYILLPGRLVKNKRVDLAIESMKLVKEDINLYIIGDGPERDKLEKIARNDKRIIFLGNKSESELKEYYSKCLAVIYTPLNEDWGLVPLEAAASGKPTIGVNEGGLKETIVNGKTGILVEAKSEKIALAISQLVKNPKKAANLGENAKKRVKEFDWGEILPQLDKYIEKYGAHK